MGHMARPSRRWPREALRRSALCLAAALARLALAAGFPVKVERKTVEVALPGGGETLIYTLTARHTNAPRYLGNGHAWVLIDDERRIALPGLIPSTRIHNDLGGAWRICLSQGTDAETGHRLLKLEDQSGIIEIDLDPGCQVDDWKPHRISPLSRVCARYPEIALPWVPFGAIETASDNPTYRAGVDETDEAECRRGRPWPATAHHTKAARSPRLPDDRLP